MKPKEGGMWGAGVHMYVYHERVLPFPTASPLFCQLFDQAQQTYLQPTPGAIPDSINDTTTLKSPPQGRFGH